MTSYEEAALPIGHTRIAFIIYYGKGGEIRTLCYWVWNPAQHSNVGAPL